MQVEPRLSMEQINNVLTDMIDVGCSVSAQSQQEFLCNVQTSNLNTLRQRHLHGLLKWYGTRSTLDGITTPSGMEPR